MIRWRRNCPFVAARIWECDHEPGNPENVMDRSYFQGQIGLDLIPPLVLWAMLEFCEASPEQQAALINPPLSERAPRNGRAAAFQTAPLAKWRRERAYRITAEQYSAELTWYGWASQNAPDHPEYTYRKPIDWKAVPIPRFS